MLFPNVYDLSNCGCMSIGACRRQDEELDELSASVERIGGVGLTIHEELLAQVTI